jgi:hypothetical protein
MTGIIRGLVIAAYDPLEVYSNEPDDWFICKYPIVGWDIGKRDSVVPVTLGYPVPGRACL